MVTQATTRSGSSWSRPVAWWWQPLAGSLVAALTAFAAVAVWLAVRRLTSELQPLSPALLLGLGLAQAGVMLAGRFAALVYFRQQGMVQRHRVVWWTLASTATAIWGWALSISGTHGLTLACWWALLAAQEFIAWQRLFSRERWGGSAGWWRRASAADSGRRSRTGDPCAPATLEAPRPTNAPLTSSLRAEFAARPAVVEPAEDQDGADPDSMWLAERVSQQLTREHLLEGGELIEGWLRVNVVAGQRNQSLHVAFCPPLEQLPEISVAQLAGPMAKIKPAEAQMFGVRFDVRLAKTPSTAETLIVHFEARSPVPAERPAGIDKPPQG